MTGTISDVRTGLLIGGEEVSTPDSTPVVDPAAPGEIVGHAASALPEQSTAAVRAAVEAWPAWRDLPSSVRAERLLDALSTLHTDAEERAALLVRENGKTLAEARIELAVFEARCRLAASLADVVDDVRHLSGPPHQSSDARPRQPELPSPAFRSEVTALPVGVVTIIIPYNWPLAILAASLPYALVAGNPVIVKPPPTTPLSVVRTLAHLSRRLPPGVLNVVTGSNDNVAPLISDRRIGRIVFTGSTNAGRTMMTAAAANMTRVTLELGGNDPAIVLDDARLDDDAIQRLVTGAFLTTGQVCMGIKRVYVHRSRYAEVVDGMSAVLDTYRVGHGLRPDTTMGPLNTGRQRDFVMELRDAASAAGHEVREFGAMSDDAARGGGFFLRPALVLDPAPDARIVVEEQFGPALPILPFDDENAVVDLVNDDWSGLCSSVWSDDPDRAAVLARHLRTGTTWINNHNAVAQDDRAPFGGFRQSGLGRELGVEGLLEFTEAHTVTYPA